MAGGILSGVPPFLMPAAAPLSRLAGSAPTRTLTSLHDARQCPAETDHFVELQPLRNVSAPCNHKSLMKMQVDDLDNETICPHRAMHPPVPGGTLSAYGNTWRRAVPEELQTTAVRKTR